MRRRRRRRSSRRGKWKALGLCLGVAAVTLAPWALRRFGWGHALRVTELRIDGDRAIPATQLYGASGVRAGDPLFGASVDQVPQRLKQDPRVKSVSVRRDVTGGVHILVAERKPVALVNMEELYLIDREGHLLGKAQADSPENLDRVTMTGPWGGRKSDRSWEEEFRDGLKLLAEFREEGFPDSTVSEIHFDADWGWSMYRVGSRARIVVGADRYREKARRLRRVLGEVAHRTPEVREIDLDFDGRVIVKLRGMT